jgi:hypothetical protein
MAYTSAFFDGVQEILSMADKKDPRLLTWLMGRLGVPFTASGVEPIAALQDFKEFSNNIYNRGPLRVEDVTKINEMILFQQIKRSGLTSFDAKTLTTWEWDGNPLTHIVVAMLGQDVSGILGNDDLAEACMAIEWRALDMLIQIDNPALELLAHYAKKRKTTLEQCLDVASKLKDLDTKLQKTIVEKSS